MNIKTFHRVFIRNEDSSQLISTGEDKMYDLIQTFLSGNVDDDATLEGPTFRKHNKQRIAKKGNGKHRLASVEETITFNKTVAIDEPCKLRL